MNAIGNTCLILGGGGYIGSHWAARLAAEGRFDRIVLADVRPPPGPLPDGCEFVTCDVRQPLRFPGLKPEWIFNFAALHREPGHRRHEYFDTNIAGARNVCAYAEEIGCGKILFTSSIAVYGNLDGPTSETSIPYPTSPYGISKLCAELIHEGWRGGNAERRLVVCRPGVVYGPGDPGNMLRMIHAIQKGYFVFPGSRYLRKSYGYIEGLLDSFEFMMDRTDPQSTYNYVERETEPLKNLVKDIQDVVGRKLPTFTAPLPLLQAVAAMAQLVTAGRSPLHPVRVRKTAMSTHIVPETLVKLGFQFRYDFSASLKDWAAKAPGDFV